MKMDGKKKDKEKKERETNRPKKGNETAGQRRQINQNRKQKISEKNETIVVKQNGNRMAK